MKASLALPLHSQPAPKAHACACGMWVTTKGQEWLFSDNRYRCCTCAIRYARDADERMAVIARNKDHMTTPLVMAGSSSSREH
jgi:hypothetical protein